VPVSIRPSWPIIATGIVDAQPERKMIIERAVAVGFFIVSSLKMTA
jgi:hypothetical protein